VLIFVLIFFNSNALECFIQLLSVYNCTIIAENKMIRVYNNWRWLIFCGERGGYFALGAKLHSICSYTVGTRAFKIYMHMCFKIVILALNTDYSMLYILKCNKYFMLAKFIIIYYHLSVFTI